MGVNHCKVLSSTAVLRYSLNGYIEMADINSYVQATYWCTHKRKVVKDGHSQIILLLKLLYTSS